MLKWTTETGETRHLAVHALPAWGGGSQCDTADIIAALKANPEACAEVLAGMGTTHFAARDAEWWHDRFVAEKARAERAEHSLAASERALAALRYQAEAGGCELSTVGENFYHCRADALCGLCRLRHRAEQAERDLAALRDQVAVAGCECSTFGERTYNCRHDNLCGLCRLRHRAENAERERDALKAKLAEAERENLTLRNRIGIDRTSWHEAEAEVKVLRAKLAKTERERDDAMTLAEERRDYARAQNAKLSVECDDLRAQLTAVERERDEARAERDVATKEEDRAKLNLAKAAEQIEALRARLAKTERVVEAAREDAQHCPHACSPPCPFDRAVARTRAALRALDSPVGAGTASGGSGAAIAAGHTSGTPDASSARVAGASPRGQDSTPEPAGSSCPACKGTGYLPANYEITGMTGTYRPWNPCPLCAPRPELDPESPATRREVEELRRQVERLEGLTGFGPEE